MKNSFFVPKLYHFFHKPSIGAGFAIFANFVYYFWHNSDTFLVQFWTTFVPVLS
jgi:hypothetical protein